MNHGNNVFPCFKRAFSDVLEGVVLKILLGQAPSSLFSSRSTLTIASHLSLSSNNMTWYAYKHWECVSYVILV